MSLTRTGHLDHRRAGGRAISARTARNGLELRPAAAVSCSTMARGIVVRLGGEGGEESSFSFTKVEREKLYGKKERVVVDEDGKTCSPAWLTSDGTALVPLGGTAHVWIDERWGAHDQSERRAVDSEGRTLTPAPSTLGIAQEAVEVAPARLLEHVTHTVYELTPESIGETLRTALARQKIFEAPFVYREGFEPDRVFLVANDEGTFALVGKPTGFAMLERTQLAPAGPEGDDELEGDLDFSML